MFKQGQTVRCITDDHYFIFEGREYRIEKDSCEDGFAYIVDGDGDTLRYPNSSFELVANDAGYKVGDLVRVIHNDYEDFFSLGDIKIVQGIEGHGVRLMDNEAKRTWLFLNAEVEMAEYADDRSPGSWTEFAESSNFELTNDEPVVEKQLLTMSYNGVTVTVDPSVAFSRGFAEAMLNVIYNKGV